jgi:hypothetical protein
MSYKHSKSSSGSNQTSFGSFSNQFGEKRQSNGKFTRETSFSQGIFLSSEEIAKKTESAIKWWARQPFSLAEMMEKINPSWNNPKFIGVNARNIIYNLAKNSRGDVLTEIIINDPEYYKKASFEEGFTPLNGAVWNKNGSCSAIINTLHILLTKYKFKIFKTANDIKVDAKETVFGALTSTDNPLSTQDKKTIYNWLINLPEEFYLSSLQDYMNKVSVNNMSKFQTKMMFITIKCYSAPTLIFRQALSIKTPQIAYNPLFCTLVKSVFAEKQNPSDVEFDEFFSEIDIISRRNEIVLRMIRSITEWIEEDYQNMLRKDDSIDKETHIMYSYRNCFAFLGECYAAGICKREILEYSLSMVTSNDTFTKLWISRAFVHFLIQSKFNLRTRLENEQDFLSISINCIYKDASVKTKVEFGTAFMILLNTKKIVNDDVILSFAHKQVEKVKIEEADIKEEYIEEAVDEDDIVIDQSIVSIIRRIEKIHLECDLQIYEDDLLVTFEKSSLTNREKSFSVLNGLYDINIKKGTFLNNLASFINKNIKNFKKEFKKLVDENEEIINDIQIDNPEIKNILQIFL